MVFQRIGVLVFLGILVLTTGVGPSQNGRNVKPKITFAGQFSAEAEGTGNPSDWMPLTFQKVDRHSVYDLVKDNGTVVLQAQSEASASGLVREVTIDPYMYPVVRWQWKVDATFPTSDVRKKETDDCPARLYILFEYEPDKVGLWERAAFELNRLWYGHYPPTSMLNYVWANVVPVETILPSPSTKRIQMVAVESGSQRQGQWVQEERNVVEDYRAAFGVEPPMIAGVAIMTDTDDTQTSARTLYGDIQFHRVSE